jgi:hypothetical protein
MTHPVKIILAIALGLSTLSLSIGEAWHLAHSAPTFNFPVIPKK